MTIMQWITNEPVIVDNAYAKWLLEKELLKYQF